LFRRSVRQLSAATLSFIGPRLLARLPVLQFSRHRRRIQLEHIAGKTMKSVYAVLLAALWMISSAPANAVVLDLSTMTCKQFIEGGPDEIKMVLTWMDGWYKGDEDEAIIDTDVFVENAKKFGTYCAANPTISIVNAAEKVLGN
jgi:acid stress chaperone HdeB